MVNMDLRTPGLPWSIDASESKRFRITLAILLVVFLILAFVIPAIDLPEPDREELEALPPQLARVVLEKRELPKPEVKTPEPEPEPEKEEKPEPEPEPKPEPKPKPQPRPSPKDQTVEQAREVAQSSGLLAMQDELADLRALADSVQLDSSAELFTAKPITRKAGDKLVSQVSTAGSGGIDTSQLDQSVKQVALARRETTNVAQPDSVQKAVEAAQQARTSQRSGERSREDIRRVIDANKSAILAIYNRELRRNPSLQGSVTPELVVEQNGRVSRCVMVETTLKAPDLEQKICARMKLMNFGDKAGVGQVTFRYPIELLPG